MICLDEMKLTCGCDIRSWNDCGCVLEPFRVTRKQLRRMSKYELFVLYTRTVTDEMSPIMWRGFTKSYILEMFLNRQDSAMLTPF